jgi:hypothetical protein
MLATVTFGRFDGLHPTAADFEFPQATVRINDPAYCAKLFARANGPSFQALDHEIRQWVGDATFDVAYPEDDGKRYRVWLSDRQKKMYLYPKPALGGLSVEEWITGRLRLRRTH